MRKIRLSLLRGICQMPAYIAFERGFLKEAGIDADVEIAPTAWMVPQRMGSGDVQFAVIPWTRVVSSCDAGLPLRVICGSGIEEAAIVLQPGVEPEQVTRVAVPHEGGMKDLTAMSLVQKMGWQNAELVRMPSGDGAILAFLGEGGHAASMIEPYATILEERGLGRTIKRTGDVWPGAPGCSLSTTAQIVQEEPDLVERMVGAYLRAANFIDEQPDVASAIAGKYIGVDAKYIRKALQNNRPDVTAIQNTQAMEDVIELMMARQYLSRKPDEFAVTRFLEQAIKN
ncbi:MAG: ABC transporter substrate-binding protein [Planctomycetaceae bacterium]